MRQIAILDLQMGLMRWSKTIQISYYVAMLAGYHKKLGDFVHYLTAPNNLESYDKVYFIYEHADLFFNADWAKLKNAVFLGAYSPVPTPELPSTVKNATPDLSIYDDWLTAWLEKYPTLAENKWDVFKQTPVVLKTAKGFTKETFDDQDIVILDADLDQWSEEELYLLAELRARSIRFAYQLPFKAHNMNFLMSLIKHNKNIMRTKLWARMELNELKTADDVMQMVKHYKNNYVGRYLRIRLYFGNELWTEEQWWEQLEKALYVCQQFRYYTKQRLTLEIEHRDSFAYPALLTMAKRWSGSNDTYWRDSPLDYYFYDLCAKNPTMFAASIQDLENFSKNSSYLAELMEVLREKPERLMGLYSKSFNMQAIPARGHDLAWIETEEYKNETNKRHCIRTNSVPTKSA